MQVAHLNQFEVSLALFIREHRNFACGLDWFVRHDIEEVRPAPLEFEETSHFVHLLAIEEGMDCTCGQLALSDTLDNRLRAQLRIAPCKNAPAIGHEVKWIRLDGSPFCPLHTPTFREDRLIRILAERGEDGITFYDKFRAGDWHRAATATGIRLAQLVPDKFDARYLSILNVDPRLLTIEQQFRALSLGVFNLIQGCR